MDDTPRTYVVAVKREARATVPADLLQRLGSLPGVDIVGGHDGPRALVRATTEGLGRLRKAVGDYCHIEETIEHDRS